mmetsp:Transcript_6531/g.18330  ORF Transcript_6531/g.18330 Transcript_6531/m.18330 type:complete len:221 (+) Transcript_6531:1194-1856(+)
MDDSCWSYNFCNSFTDASIWLILSALSLWPLHTECLTSFSPLPTCSIARRFSSQSLKKPICLESITCTSCLNAAADTLKFANSSETPSTTACRFECALTTLPSSRSNTLKDCNAAAQSCRATAQSCRAANSSPSNDIWSTWLTLASTTSINSDRFPPRSYLRDCVLEKGAEASVDGTLPKSHFRDVASSSTACNTAASTPFSAARKEASIMLASTSERRM